ncbi:Orotidine 5'-phosphate decarboxylase [Symmachiella macrocystis]|uniref:Orotidine 5'-phosphate decarboxylase n=1 Tax=Symmachiella macrocystis TaxID=2527985 RepID=A0A5C6BK07_9PLAN|nr:orotidine-5'-phosphate decarboxylase [Symmachiella macrocystis]TWU12390.1 Orotidine 5'-phosphate decarboxylase [Symmachiella macrocystis]
MASYIERLNSAIIAKRAPVVVGLDPRKEQLPPGLMESAKSGHSHYSDATATAYERFCFQIIDIVAPLVPAVKPQAAFFEELGPSGSLVLASVIRRAREAGLIVICDAKRGDIGSTAEAYARGYLAGSDRNAAPWSADSLTVNPYLGPDTLQPFVDVAVQREAGLYVLVRTSNPGAAGFQDLIADGQTHYRHVAAAVEQLAQETRGEQTYGAVGAVVGATYPQELAELRAAMPHTHFLIPGYGSQGGTAQDIAAAFDADGLGAIVNSSRGIIFAYNNAKYKDQFAPEQWESAVEAATRDMIADLAEHTPAGALGG